MKRSISIAIAIALSVLSIQAQPNIFDPNDVVYTYNSGAAAGSVTNPNAPASGQIAKWVRTVRMGWNTDKFKCYIIGNLPFRVRFPKNYQHNVNDGKKYPVIIFWHGGGEANTNIRDNEHQLIHGAQQFAGKIDNNEFDGFLLFPQSPQVGWDTYLQFIPMNNVMDSLTKYCKLDPDKVISMGLSIGGFAAADYTKQFPQRVAKSIPSAPSFIDYLISGIPGNIHVPMWVGYGGVDGNPTPGAVESYINAYKNQGGSIIGSLFPTLGHFMWYDQWAEPRLVPEWNSSHKANPLIFFNKKYFCPDSPVNAKLGLTPGFAEYEWQKDNNPIIGATTNEITVTSFGTYRARFKRTSTSAWSDWSQNPAVISPICPPVAGTGTGLKGDYYNNITLTSPVALTRTDGPVNFAWGNSSPASGTVNSDNFSVRWTGQVQPQFSETYTFYTNSDDGVRMWVNGQQLVNNWTDHGATENSGTIALTANVKYNITIEYYDKTGGATLQLYWSSPSVVKEIIPKLQLYPTTGTSVPPGCAINSSPATGSTIGTSTTASLVWNAAATATAYDLYLWTGATAPATPTVANITTTSYNATGLTANTLYRWYVVPKNANGSATGCSANQTTFTTAPLPPACATNTSPANNTTLASPTAASLVWNPAATATAYDLYLWTGATAPATPTVANITTNTYSATGLNAATVYNWYVVPKNTGGSATGCATNATSFTTAVPPAPNCTNNTSPANAATITTYNTAALTWAAAATATSYDIYVWTGATAPLTPTANVTTTAYNATALTGSTVYNWYVVPKNATGNAVGCSTNATSFTTAVPPPPCANNTSPIDGSVTPNPTSASLTWDAVATATSYDVFAYTGTTIPATPIANVTTTSYNAAGLVANTTYNWFVTPKNGSGAATGCSANKTSFTTAPPPPPNCTNNTSPANAATITTYNTAALTWAAAATATSYDVYVWTGATAPLTPTANVTTTAYNATALTGSTLYNWYVVPKNATGNAVGCSTNATSFTTAVPPPPCANNTSPANAGVTANYDNATLVWGAVATATSYDVYFWTGATAPASPTANVTTTSYAVTGLTGSTLYRWYVVPKNASGSAAGCSASQTSFTTAAPPACCTGTGLKGDYFNNTALTAPVVLSRTDATVNFDWQYGAPAANLNTNAFSVRWTGQVQPLFTQTYTFYTSSDDGVRLWVNGVQLINQFVSQGTREWSGTIALTANVKYDIKLEYFEGGGGANCKLSWSSASTPKQIIPQTLLYPTGYTGTNANLITSIMEQGPAVNTITKATVAPNPVVSGQTARLQFNSSTKGATTMQITDLFGRLLLTQRLSTNEGVNTVLIDTKGLQRGIHLVRIENAAEIVTLKLNIQ
jgi:hypothetical protein